MRTDDINRLLVAVGRYLDLTDKDHWTPERGELRAAYQEALNASQPAKRDVKPPRDVPPMDPGFRKAFPK